VSGRRRGPVTDEVPPDLALVLIDGDNLLRRVRGVRDEGSLRWLLPRLRAWRPPNVEVVVMLDGHPAPGEVMRRRALPGIDFQYSGSVDGDTALLGLLAARPFVDRARTVLVTDDRALADRARHTGGLARRLDWLTSQLAVAGYDGGAPGPRTASSASRSDGSARPVTVGAGRPPSPASAPPPPVEREPWKPGRGATRKKGNAHRGVR
jgi:hypothetical protein